MNRLKEICEFNEREYRDGLFIEPDERTALLWERIDDVITTYEPRVVVKAGIGRGEIIKRMVEAHEKIVLVVVEPSLELIKKFIEDNKSDDRIRKIRYINGSLNRFPVDYYGADLIISIDNLNIMESAPVIDEFKRALEFEAHLFIAGVVLDDEDIEGTYDEYMKTLLPLHNDYYLHEDLKTLLSLKEFAFIKGKAEYVDLNLNKQHDYISSVYKINEEESREVMASSEEVFRNLYHFDGENIKLPYFTGLFMRKKIKTNAPV